MKCLALRMLCFIPAVYRSLMCGSFGSGERPMTVLLSHVLMVVCLFRLMSLTIFHNSCSWFKYQKCYHVTLFCITIMWKEKNCYICSFRVNENNSCCSACCKRDLLPFGTHFSTFFLHTKMLKAFTEHGFEMYICNHTFCYSGWRQYNSSVTST